MSIATDDTCPACSESLIGSPIPQEHIDSGFYAPGVTHYRRVIGIEYPYGHPERYDGVSEWRCPFCGYREGRWTGKPLAEGEVEPRYGIELAAQA